MKYLAEFAALSILLTSANIFAGDLSVDLQEANVTYKDNTITATTGKVERTWEWTGSGFQTVSYKELSSGYEWCRAPLSHSADWDLPTRIGNDTKGTLLSVECIESDDEKFTSRHLLLTCLVRYPCGVDLRFLARIYPGAPGIWTALEVKAFEGFSPEGIHEDLATYNYYGSQQPVKIARSEFIPVDFSQKNRRRYWGIYNDPGNRANTKDMVREKVVRGWPIFQDEQNTWASGLSIEAGENGLILVKESNKTVNKYGHQTGSFYCTPEGVEVTGWGLKPGEITSEFRRTWATWTILYSGGEDEMELALKQFDRIRFPIVLERDMHILIDTWGSDHRNGQDDKSYGRENSVYSIVSEEVKTASRMGIDIVRIDDGWQQGKAFENPVWLPAPEAGYKPAWKKLKKLAADQNVRIGLWAAIRFISPEEMRQNQADLNVATWKLDFDKLPDWEAFHTRMNGIRSFIKDSKYKTQVSWCPEYDDQRYGWYSPAKEYGPMYFQNIMNYLPNHIVYVPYITLRGHWSMSRFYNMNKLQCNWQNPALTNPAFSDAHLHSQSYSAMSAFMGAPSCFMLTQLLTPQQQEELTRIIGLYKSHRKEIFEGFVFPVGDEPNNASWSGFQVYHPDKNTGYLMLFREIHNAEKSHEFKLKFIKDTTLEITDLEKPDESPEQFQVSDGKLSFRIEKPADYLFLKYEIIE